MSPVFVAVVETPEFIAAASRIMTADERSTLIEYIAAHPAAGVLLPGTGGVRKLRWALAGRGKRGGARIIYYYYNREIPIFAITAYAKNELENLSQADRNEFRKLTRMLVENYRRARK